MRLMQPIFAICDALGPILTTVGTAPDFWTQSALTILEDIYHSLCLAVIYHCGHGTEHVTMLL